MSPSRFIGQCPLILALLVTLVLVFDAEPGSAESFEARGRVIDREGKPVANAEILLSDFRRTTCRTTTQDNGMFQLGCWSAPQGLILRVEAEGFITHQDSFPTPNSEEADKEILQVVLVPPSQVIGRVIDAEGTPVPSAEMRLQAVLDTRVVTTAKNRSLGETDEAGFFSLVFERSGTYQLTASHPEHAALLTPVMDLKIEDDSTDLGDISLEAGEGLEGRVSSPDGVPLGGVSVHAAPPLDIMRIFHDAWLRYQRSANSKADGRFELRGLKSGGRLEIVASKSGWVTRRLEITAPMKDPLELILEPSLRLTGIILDADRRPVKGAHISDPSGLFTARSDGAGHFSIDDMKKGPVVFRVRSRAQEVLLEQKSLESDEHLEIVLPPTGKLELRGVLRNRDGKPVEGAQVASDRGSQAPVRTGRDGGFLLQELKPGQQVLDVYHPTHGRIREIMNLEVGNEPIELHYDGFAVAGRLRDAETGLPIANASLHLESKQGTPSDSWSATSSPNGRFRFANVANGTFRIRGVHQDYAAHFSEFFEIEAKDLLDIEIGLEVGSTVQGHVLGVELEDLSEWQIKMSSIAGIRRGLLDEGGHFRVEHLSPGTWYLHLYRDQELVVSEQILIESPSDLVEVDLVP